MQCPRGVFFDLDDTLALTFESPSVQMIDKLIEVLALMPLAIITGRDFPWMARDFLPQITQRGRSEGLYVFPEGAAQGLQWYGAKWQELYGESLSEEDRERIKKAILESVEETGILKDMPVFGERFVQKRAMVAFAALGYDVPADLKYSWDPGNLRRSKLRDAIAAKLPEFDVLMGGATSTDVTKKGVNKSYGVNWLSKHLNIPASEMLYVGDALFPGGNDFVVIETGIQTRITKGPAETLGIIDELLKACTL
ncbi:MAG TPA: HAD-IIB family hydrolase [Candidatus Paceibacterota bacterium]|nr:HAD-IIB family hydrolase [Candidatus Paceibacterota bacterium]